MQQKSNFLIPIAIVLAGGLIAFSLFIVKRDSIGSSATQIQSETQTQHPEEKMLPITSADHILGNPNAQVFMVEYSDTDCPFCQSFMPSLHKIINQYGAQGKVAWVYRHFAFHPHAPKEAEATECANEVGGNSKFWEFLDVLFSKKDFHQNPYIGVDPAQLPDLAASIGINKSAFSQCLSSGKYATKVSNAYNQAVAAGAQGTPYTILVTKNSKIPITNGAIPYDQLKAAIDALLNSNS